MTQETEKQNEDEDDEEKRPRMVEDANLAAKRLEMANKVMSVNLDRQEALAAEASLGGKADAGEDKKEEVKKETDEEYAKKAMSGELNVEEK